MSIGPAMHCPTPCMHKGLSVVHVLTPWAHGALAGCSSCSDMQVRSRCVFVWCRYTHIDSGKLKGKVKQAGETLKEGAEHVKESAEAAAQKAKDTVKSAGHTAEEDFDQ